METVELFSRLLLPGQPVITAVIDVRDSGSDDTDCVLQLALLACLKTATVH